MSPFLRILSACLAGGVVLLLFSVLLPFLLDVFSEISYSLWSRSVTRQYAKQFGSGKPKASAVPVDDSRYTLPLVIWSVILVAEVVLCIILL